MDVFGRQKNCNESQSQGLSVPGAQWRFSISFLVWVLWDWHQMNGAPTWSRSQASTTRFYPSQSQSVGTWHRVQAAQSAPISPAFKQLLWYWCSELKSQGSSTDLDRSTSKLQPTHRLLLNECTGPNWRRDYCSAKLFLFLVGTGICTLSNDPWKKCR